MAKNNTYIFPNHHYPVEITFIPDKKSWKKEIKRRDLGQCDYPGKANGASAMCFTWADNAKHPYLTVIIDVKKLRVKDKNLLLGIAAHEALHILDYLLEILGEDKPGAEMKAYFMQYYTTFLMVCFEDYMDKKGWTYG